MAIARHCLVVCVLVSWTSMSQAMSSARQANQYLDEGSRSPEVSGDIAPSIFYYPVAAGGACIDRSNEDALKVLKRNGISTRGRPTSKELEALATGIAQVENLLGRPLPKSWRTPYNYINSPSSYTWNQATSAINVRRPKGSASGQNVGGLMHELGHKIGNTGEYAAYRSFIGKQECKITHYAKKKANEQFAEAFAAYVAYPDKLARVCPKAYNFFSQKMFPNGQQQVASCESFDKSQDSRRLASEKRSKPTESDSSQNSISRNGVR